MSSYDLILRLIEMLIEEKEKKAQWCITSIKEGKYLNYNNKDQTGVYLDSKRVYWELTLLGEGQIKLSNTVGHSTRYLGFNPIQGENNGYFGNYKTCQSDTLLIFMHDLTLSEKKGELQLPADSDRIALIAETLIDGRLPHLQPLDHLIASTCYQMVEWLQMVLILGHIWLHLKRPFTCNLRRLHIYATI